MRILFTWLLFLAMALVSCTGYSEPEEGDGMDDPVPTIVNPKANQHLLFLRGVITGATIAPLTDALDMVIRSGSNMPITIVINSPGGGVIAGMAFINRMQTLRDMGVTINCYVLDVAASMAFQIFTQCNNRYALPTSYLLWHGVRMGSNQPITASLARNISEDLARMDEIVLQELDGSLRISNDVIRKHFDNETLWSGYGLNKEDSKFMTLGTFPKLMQKLGTAVQMGSGSFFDLGEGMIYIWGDWTSHVFNVDGGIQ